MRTTLNISDDLYRRIRVRAAEQDATVTSVVEQALTELLEADRRAPREKREPFRIRPLGHAWGPLPGVDLHDNSALLDIMEEGVPLEKRR